MNVHQVKIWDIGTVSLERNKGAIVRWKHRVLGRLASPSIPLMLHSLILPAVLLADQAMTLNFTFAYVPGFFAQDDLDADPNVIGPVSEMWLAGCARG